MNGIATQSIKPEESSMEDKVVTVDGAAAGLRLDLFLARRSSSDGRPDGLSRAEIQRLICEGRVSVNGRRTKASVRLKPNDTIRIQTLPLRDTSLLPENIPLDILYEDEHCIVINKAAGMMVHPATGRYTGTLVNALLHHCPDLGGIGGERRPGIVHRLDKDTSGVMVVAKTQNAFQRLGRQFKDRQVQKEYLALVWGKMSADCGVIDRPIGRHRSDRKRMSSRYPLPKRREAITQWQVEKLFKSGTSATWVSLLRLKPKTGRTHQLRVHLADLGHPIVGDRIYGHKRKGDARKNLYGKVLDAFPRHALHAEKLSFFHPGNQTYMTFRAPLPQDMQDLLNMLTHVPIVPDV
jgi:23S rRNA pseudouridine1911/1915/1917 synthase